MTRDNDCWSARHRQAKFRHGAGPSDQAYFPDDFLTAAYDHVTCAHSAAARTYVSEIFFPQLFQAATFGERPKQAADAAHLLLLAGSQRRCSVDRASALKVCLCSVEIFDWKD